MGRRRAFTLVELLVAIGVVTTLIGLTLPAVQAARDAAARAACQDRLRQIGIGLHSHHAARGTFPRNGGGMQGPGGTSPDRVLTWMVGVLPETGEAALYAAAVEACKTEVRGHMDPPHTGNSTPVKLYACPADGRLGQALTTGSGRRVAFTSFIGVAGTAVGPSVTTQANGDRVFGKGVFDAQQPARLTDVSDGTSHTIMVAERPPPATLQAGEWYQSGWVMEQFGGPDGVMYYRGPFGLYEDPCPSSPYGPGRLDNPCDRKHFWSLHRGGANFLFADGSVRLLPYSAEPIMSALCTRAGGEVAEIP